MVYDALGSIAATGKSDSQILSGFTNLRVST